MLQRAIGDLMGMRNILVLNDEAHHCYRAKPADRGRRRTEGGRSEGSREKQRSGTGLDFGTGSREPQARAVASHRPVGHAVLSARLWVARRDAVPLDDERLFADGRHRVRHRQAAARSDCGQHSRQRDADVPQPVGTHPHQDAEVGSQQGRRPRPARSAPAASDCARRALRSLRKDICAVGRARDPGAPLLHRRLQQHGHIKARLRLHLGIPAPAQRRQ
jgi:hypothetical protein